MSIQMTFLRDWVKTIWIPTSTWANLEVDVSIWPDIPDMPDRLITIQEQTGAGELMEGLFEWSGLGVFVRGPQIMVAQGTPADVARQLDKDLLFGAYPHALWGNPVQGVQRNGGGPANVAQLDNGRRMTYSCAYQVHCALL